jgi:hypothetical protein
MALSPLSSYKRTSTEEADMKNRKHRVILGVGASIIGVLAIARPADAQVREARGTVSAVTDTTLSIRTGNQELTFFVDGETHLEVRAAERNLQREQPGRPSPRVNSFFEPGQAVLVRYREEKGRNHALDIGRVGSAGSGESQKISDGKVKLVTPSQLTIDDNGRQLTFGITGDTNVLVKGATKATKAAGGSTPITTFVHAGDIVSVSYRESDATMIASEVRVRVVSK